MIEREKEVSSERSEDAAHDNVVAIQEGGGPLAADKRGGGGVQGKYWYTVQIDLVFLEQVAC